MDITLYATTDFLPDLQIRDRDNVYPDTDPIDLTWGLDVRLNFVLFRGRDYGTDPFHLPDGIVDWHWAIDNDYDRSTPPLVEGDNEQIEVVATDAETRIVVPFTVNGTRLESMLAGRSCVEGLTGELVGIGVHEERHFNSQTISYETGEFRRIFFCMQLPNIKVWNRIA